MTILRIPPPAQGPATGLHDRIFGADRARMQAQWRHQATVLTISGDIDTSNGDRFLCFVARFILVGNAVVVDLRGVDFCAARGVSVLIAVDDACRAAGVPWALVPSCAVRRVLQLSGCDTTVPTANSVPEALCQVTALGQARRRVARAAVAAQRQAR